MRTGSMRRAIGAIGVALVLTLGVTTAPAGANPTDTYWPPNHMSHQYNLGGCLYKVFWSSVFGAPFTLVYFYNLTACGGALVAIEYNDGTTKAATSTTVSGSGSDGCGAYQTIVASAPAGTPLRGLVWVGTGVRWYANDGTYAQPIHSFC